MATATASTHSTDALDRVPPPPPVRKFVEVVLGKIKANPYQYRTDFETGMDELVASVKRRGILSVPLARPSHAKGAADDEYELAFGDRRRRACAIAGLATMPLIVVDMTDDEMIEAMFLENLNREDVSPLEEGEGFSAALARGYTVEYLEKKTDKSRSYIYSRMDLVKLPGPVKKLIAAGTLGPAIAALLVPIEGAKRQEQAAKEVLGHGDEEAYTAIDIQPEAIAPVDEKGEAQTSMWDVRREKKVEPLSYRAAKALIHRRYMRYLAPATFLLDDETLVEGVGGCGPCPYRLGGASADLFGNVAVVAGKDVCSRPTCFEAKTKAAWEHTAAAAEARGVKVLEGNAAKEVFYAGSAEVADSADYADPTRSLPPSIAKPGSTVTWAKALGKEYANVPKVLVQDADGAARELLDKDAATKKLKELGKLDQPTKPKNDRITADNQKQRDAAAKERAQRDIRERIATRAVAAVGVVLRGDVGEKRELAWMRLLAKPLIRELDLSGTDGGDRAFALHDVDSFTAFETLVEKAKTVAEIRVLIAELIVATEAEAFVMGHGKHEIFDAAMTLAGVDLKKLEQQAKETAKAESKVDAAASKAPAKSAAKAAKKKASKAGKK